MDEILGAVSMLAQDQYGNYVVQVLNLLLQLLIFGLFIVTLIDSKVVHPNNHNFCMVYFIMVFCFLIHCSYQAFLHFGPSKIPAGQLVFDHMPVSFFYDIYTITHSTLYVDYINLDFLMG